MDNGTPKPSRLQSSPSCLVGTFFTILLVGLVAISWRLTPVVPYATIPAAELRWLRFSPDGSMLTAWEAVMDDGPIRIWDVATGREKFRAPLGWESIFDADFSPESSLFAAVRDKELKVWETKTGSEVGMRACEPRYLSSLRFSPDGKFLAYQAESKGDKDFVCIWNIGGRQPDLVFEGDVGDMTFAADGKTFGRFRRPSGFDFIDEVEIWKMEPTPTVAARYRVDPFNAAFSPDLGRLALVEGTPDKGWKIALRDGTNANEVWSTKMEDAGFDTQSKVWVSFEAEGKVLSARGVIGGTTRTALWDVTGSPKLLGAYPTPAVAVSAGLDSLTVPTAAGLKIVRIGTANEFDLDVAGDFGSWNNPSTFHSYSVQLWSKQAFSPDAKTVFAECEYEVADESFLGRWLPKKWNPFPKKPAERTRQVALRVWDVESRETILSVEDCYQFQLSPDGTSLATLRSKDIDLWHVPLRVSPWRALGWPLLAWALIATGWWAWARCRHK